jgi:isoamylase
LNWNLDSARDEMMEFARQVLSIRKGNAAFRRDAFFNGKSQAGLPDVIWLDVAGRELSDPQWRDPQKQYFMMLVRAGVADGEVQSGNYQGTPWVAGNGFKKQLLLLVNARAEPQIFHLPNVGLSWTVVLSTEKRRAEGMLDGLVTLMDRSLLLLASA